VALYPAQITQAVTPLPELSQITITNPAGGHNVVLSLSNILGSSRSVLVGLGWAEPEMLVAVASDGSCSVLSPQGIIRLSLQRALKWTYFKTAIL
jgi:hypothetical protein